MSVGVRESVCLCVYTLKCACGRACFMPNDKTFKNPLLWNSNDLKTLKKRNSFSEHRPH